MPTHLKRDRCTVEGCDRLVWFTAEQLCRPHGLAAGADQEPENPNAVADDDPLWRTDEPPTAPTGRKSKAMPPASPKVKETSDGAQ